jgi:hypothetical protein
LSLPGENWARPSESVLFASEKGLNSAIYDALETGRIFPHNPLRQLHDKSIGKALQNEKLFSCVCVCVVARLLGEFSEAICEGISDCQRGSRNRACSLVCDQ